MKTKLLIGLMAMALVLSISGTTQAVTLQTGPGIFKTWNWEIGTNYFGGESGKFYFRNDTAEYDTVEFGNLAYDGANPNHGLISDLLSVRDPSLRDGEDTFALYQVRTIGTANVGPQDSRFGDGSNANPLGNDIIEIAGGGYWASGDNDEHLRGLMWGNQDQIVQCILPGDPLNPDPTQREGIYRIWSSGAQFELFEIIGDAAYDPASDPAYSPAARPDAAADPEGNDFPDWFDRNNDELVAGGIFNYFRFQGNLLINDNGDPIIDGNTEVVIDLEYGTLIDDYQWIEWWQHPEGEPGRTSSEIWQTWNIGDPFTISNGWVGSEDSARFYIVPEPMTMLGVFLGVSSLTGYIRKRRMA